jgi:hypothetical protein
MRTTGGVSWVTAVDVVIEMDDAERLEILTATAEVLARANETATAAEQWAAERAACEWLADPKPAKPPPPRPPRPPAPPPSSVWAQRDLDPALGFTSAQLNQRIEGMVELIGAEVAETQKRARAEAQGRDCSVARRNRHAAIRKSGRE